MKKTTDFAVMYTLVGNIRIISNLFIIFRNVTSVILYDNIYGASINEYLIYLNSLNLFFSLRIINLAVNYLTKQHS